MLAVLMLPTSAAIATSMNGQHLSSVDSPIVEFQTFFQWGHMLGINNTAW